MNLVIVATFLATSWFKLATCKELNEHVLIKLDSPATNTYSLKCGQCTYFKVNMIYPCKDLNISITPYIGSVNILVDKQIMYPVITDKVFSTNQRNKNDVLISHWNTAASPGYYYIGVYNRCQSNGDKAKFSISATSQVDDTGDIFVNPSLAMNKLVEARGYTTFRFCIPICADIKVHIENCQGPRINCPGGNSSYSELFTSRTEIQPSMHGYTYKSATGRREYFIQASDPLARDPNGYFTGPYYVSAYGYCVEDEYLFGDEDSGLSCKYATIPFNITITTYPVVDTSVCTTPVTVPTAPTTSTSMYPIITPGVTYNGYVDISMDLVTPSYYHKLPVTQSCMDINFYMLTLTDPLASSAEFSIGKYPNIAPNLLGLQWTSYDYKIQNFTISAYDPALDTGVDCGPYKNETCYLYIGIIGYSFTPGIIQLLYQMKVTFLSPSESYNSPIITTRFGNHIRRC